MLATPGAEGDGTMSTAAHPPTDEPLIPMPALTPNGLRAAIRILAPSREAEFRADLEQASTWAVEQSSITPLRVIVHKWSVVVAIERIPARAARFHALEYRTSTANTEEEARAITTELRQILIEAEREITA
jgi:hypothetical protein